MKFIFVIAFIIIIQSVSYSQWIPQSIPVNKPIIGIEFVNENTGWAISYNTLTSDTAYIIGTSNGGATWNIQFRGDIGLYCMSAIDNNICYAGGADTNGFSIFLKTTNGGKNWESMNVSALLIMTDMFFINKDTGYVCDEFFGGLKLTTDAGTSWVNRESGLNISQPRTLFFLNYDTGFCGGSFYLFKTTNAGMNWNLLFDFGFLGNRQPLAIQFLNDMTGWTGLTNNGVGITSNGGLNWTLVIPVTIGTYEISGLSFANDSIGWAGPDISERIYKTKNGGINWTEQNPHVWGSRSISFIDTLTGWSGYHGISKTTNGGLTFISGINQETPNSFKLYQNYPNPFNPSTNIRFTIIQPSNVEISIFDILGREIYSWKSDGSLQSGTYEYKFINENLSGGVYIYRLTARSSSGNSIFTDSKKMIYVK